MALCGSLWSFLAIRLLGIALFAPWVISTASAQEFPIATNRAYTLDIYQGSAMGSSRIVGMGGVAAATAQGSSGMLTNPAAAGVRPTTSNDTWDWDWHLESQTPAVGSDSDNNGIPDADIQFHPTTTLGLVLQYKDWGIGVAAINQATQSTFSEAGKTDTIDTSITLAKFSVSHFMFDGQLVVGGGAQLLVMQMTSQIDSTELINLSGASFESGALWKPNGQSYRIGGSFSLPVVADQTDVENCDPLDCQGYVLPSKVKVPWRATIGLSGRRAKTPWNIRYKSEWRDEKALLWAADLVLTGRTHRGAGLEAFAQHQVQPSGRQVSLSLRGGVEYEWLPGRLRVRGGSYYEPGRFEDTSGNEIAGRLHMTLGLDWNFWRLKVWGSKYRAQVSSWLDASQKFGVSGVSFGFWH